MKGLIALALAGTMAAAGCSVSKADGVLRNEEAMSYYELESPYTQIPLFGDYWLHPLKAKYFKDIDKSFLKYTSGRLHGKKPQLLFAGHTIVTPYYATVAMIYTNTRLDSALLQQAAADLKADIGTSFGPAEALTLSYGPVTAVRYQVKNPVTKVFTRHQEYFIPNKGNLIRLFFWNTDHDERTIQTDIQWLLEQVRVEL